MPQAQPTIACLCAFGVALINNSGFCVVIAASQHLADKVFFAPNLLTLFTFSANLAAFAATFCNARFLVKFSFISRIRGACIALLVGYGMLAVAVLLHGEPPICMDPIPAPRYFSRLKPRERCEWMGHVWMERPNYLVRCSHDWRFCYCLSLAFASITLPLTLVMYAARAYTFLIKRDMYRALHLLSWGAW